MIIKKFNESIDSNDKIIVSVRFSGDLDIPLTELKKTEYYKNYREDDDDEDEYKNILTYCIEEYIYNQGIIKYTFTAYNKNGDEIENIQEYEKLLNDTNKYNV